MECDYCQIANGKEKREVIYQDGELIAFIEPTAIALGEIVIVPKEHFTIFEMIPKKLISKMSAIANKLSISVFDSLQVQGTNIVIDNGLGAGQSVPHFSMKIVPRNENDSVNLEWEPNQVGEAELEDAFIQISSMTENLEITDKDTVEVVKSEGKTEVVLEKEDGEENYLLKSLKRIP